jgi:hypothetical protein
MQIHADLNPDPQLWFDIYKLSIQIELSVHINWREQNFGLKNFSTLVLGKNFNTLVLGMKLPNADGKGTVYCSWQEDNGLDLCKKNYGLKVC